ncbi:MAG TPA: phosphatidylserine decarboxylase family protein [Acidobacteriaceae bacterium]
MVRDGYYYGIAFVGVAIALAVVTHVWAWSLAPLALAAFFLWFFRDPARVIPQGEGLVVSPADGKVTSVDPVRTPGGEQIRISIFLNVFNVHVNRAPVAGTVRTVRHQQGRFINAMDEHSADQNEQNVCVLDADDGYQVTFKQIAGLLARRIVFRHREGDRLERGQRVGMIKFGSRTDILLPAEAVVAIKVGDTVLGGSSILATVATPVGVATAPAATTVLGTRA